MKISKIIIIIAILLAFTFPVYSAEKQITVLWEQDADDLPLMDYWTLFSSTDPVLPFDQWINQGNIPYVVDMPLSTNIVIIVPDGEETFLWFKLTAVGTDGISSNPSEIQEGAPTIIDFKPPEPAVLSASYDNRTRIITLTWTTQDADIITQKIFKSDVAGGPYIEIASQPSPYDYAVQPSDSGKWLYFVVVLTDDAGNFSQNSNEAAIKLVMGVPFNVRVTVSSE